VGTVHPETVTAGRAASAAHPIVRTSPSSVVWFRAVIAHGCLSRAGGGGGDGVAGSDESGDTTKPCRTQTFFLLLRAFLDFRRTFFIYFYFCLFFYVHSITE